MSGGSDASPPPGIEFVFGRGAWRIWHGFLLVLALPLFWFADYFAHFVPGAGPQGGEAVFALMLAHMLAYLLATMISAVIQAVRASGTLAQRCLARPASMFGAWLVGCALVLVALEIGTVTEATPLSRWSAVVLVALALLLVYVANWWALKLAREG